MYSHVLSQHTSLTRGYTTKVSSDHRWLCPLHGSGDARADAGVGLGVLAQAGQHGGVLVHDLGHLLAESVLAEDRATLLAGPATARVPGVVRLRGGAAGR